MTSPPPVPPPTLPAAPHTRGWVIGRIAGAPLILQPLWFVVAALLTAFVMPIVRVAAPGLSTTWTVAIAATFVVVLFASVLAHEVAHALTARRLGQSVHEVVLSALGGHTAFTRSGLGPGSSALIAAAGPAVNLVLGGLLLAASRPLLESATMSGRSAGVLLGTMAGANLLVAAFNLIPGLPLDGGQLLASFVWKVTGDQHRGTVGAAWVGRALAVGLVAWIAYSAVSSGRMPDTFQLVWVLVVAWVVWQGASGALKHSHTQSRAERLTVEAVGRPAVGIDQQASVAQVADAIARGSTEVVLLGPDGAVVALVVPEALAQVPPEQRHMAPAWSVAQPLVSTAWVDADLRGRTLLERLVAAFREQPVVVARRGGRVVAVLHDGEVARHLSR